MKDEMIRKLYWENVTLIDASKNICKTVRQQNGLLQTWALRRSVQCSKTFLEALMEASSTLEEAGIQWDYVAMNQIMLRIQEAQSEEDWAFLSDLYEMELIPLLFDLQGKLQLLDIEYARPEWFFESLKVLENKNTKLYGALCDYGEGASGPYYENTMYEVNVSKQGYYTLTITENNHTWNICSQNMPMLEAEEFIDYVYSREKESYLVYGLGMGYHIRALLAKNADLDIVVYEPDLDIIYCALMFSDCKDMMEKVTLIWDPEWLGFAELMKNREILALRSEVRHIPIPSVRNKMEHLMNRKDSVDAFGEIFYLNSRENFRSCTDYIDSIKNEICGKKIVIVAAGPSLDRNLELLMTRSDEVVVIAVGTVYKLMVQKGIMPDYIIASDAYVSYQILGVPATVPVLMLATADCKIAKYYQGTTFLICQSGYDVAAEYAKEHNYQTYDSGGSVATLALDVCIRLGAKSIAFIGLDLAYHGTRAHAEGTGKETYDGTDFEVIEGQNGETLHSSQAFTNYRIWMERRINEEDVTMPIIDATEGGAIKKGFKIMTLEEYLKL